jgi:hypothetical protein
MRQPQHLAGRRQPTLARNHPEVQKVVVVEPKHRALFRFEKPDAKLANILHRRFSSTDPNGSIAPTEVAMLVVRRLRRLHPRPPGTRPRRLSQAKTRLDSVKAALGWSALWISLGVAFSGLIYLGYEHHWLGLGTGVDTMATAHVGDGVTYYNDGGTGRSSTSPVLRREVPGHRQHLRDRDDLHRPGGAVDAISTGSCSGASSAR